VVLVTSRFWPLADERALRAMAVARRLASAGAGVTVLTPQWGRQWPCQMTLDEVRVVRLRGAPQGGLASLRWYFHLARWLRRQRPPAVGVMGLGHEASVALAAGRRGGWPTILLAETDDPVARGQAALGRRVMAACQSAAAVVVPSARFAEALAGWGLRRIEILPWAADTPPGQDASQREAARRALAGINPDLVAPPPLPVVLTFAALAPHSQLDHVIGAWTLVAARRPDARLWIVGDGPLRERLYRQIQDLDLRFRVLLPGTFDSLQELCHAADALLVPTASLAPPLALVEGMAAGLRVFLPRSPLGEELWSAPGGAGRIGLFPPADRVGLAQTVLAWLDHWQPPRPAGPRAAPAPGRGQPGSPDPLGEPGGPPTSSGAGLPPADAASTPLFVPAAAPPGQQPPCGADDEGQKLAALVRRLVDPRCHAAPPRSSSPASASDRQ
jgi:glycosyltransferase involved in cell wall biosynthesis